MTKTQLRKQIDKLVNARSKELYAKFKESARLRMKEVMDNDDLYRKAHDSFIYHLTEAAEFSQVLQDKGITSLSSCAISTYYLTSAWDVQEYSLAHMINYGSCNFSTGYNADHNVLLDNVREAYFFDLQAAASEFKKIEEIITGMPAGKAFKALTNAGVPLTREGGLPNLPDTKLMVDLSVILGSDA